MTVMMMVRRRGLMSHSRWKTCCHVPKHNFPSLMGIVIDGPSIVACKWEWPFPSCQACSWPTASRTVSGAKRRQQRNGFLTILAEKAEVAVRGANRGIGIKFREPHHAGIREVHGGICILGEQFCYWNQIVGEGNRFQPPTCERLDHLGLSNPFLGNQVTDFSHHSLA